MFNWNTLNEPKWRTKSNEVPTIGPSIPDITYFPVVVKSSQEPSLNVPLLFATPRKAVFGGAITENYCSSSERLFNALFDLFVGSGSVVALCRLETLVAEDVLGLLHQKASLVEECAARVSSQMPMDMLLDTRCGGHLPDHPVTGAVMPNRR